MALFDAIEPLLFRYPAIDPKAFRNAVERTLQALNSDSRYSSLRLNL
ncbi:MAG: hypothetical protein ABI779_08735 [Acidobacteriota bacterium]